MGFATTVQAKQKVCVFDLLGKAGETFGVTQEWAVTAKNWQAEIQLIPYQDEKRLRVRNL